MDGMLTQEEIDALTGGDTSGSAGAQDASGVSEGLTDGERRCWRDCQHKYGHSSNYAVNTFK